MGNKNNIPCPRWKCKHFGSGAEVYCELFGEGLREGMARISTRTLKKQGLYVDIPISPGVVDNFRKLNLTSDFGVMFVSPDENDEENLQRGTITEFLSYNRIRNPEPGPAQDYSAMLTASGSKEQYGLDGYTEQFEELVRLGYQGEFHGLCSEQVSVQ